MKNPILAANVGAFLNRVAADMRAADAARAAFEDYARTLTCPDARNGIRSVTLLYQSEPDGRLRVCYQLAAPVEGMEALPEDADEAAGVIDEFVQNSGIPFDLETYGALFVVGEEGGDARHFLLATGAGACILEVEVEPLPAGITIAAAAAAPAASASAPAAAIAHNGWPHVSGCQCDFCTRVPADALLFERAQEGAAQWARF